MRVKHILLMVPLAGLLLAVMPVRASAQDASYCQPQTNSVQAMGRLPADSYNVYVKLGGKADQARVEVYFNLVEGFGTAGPDCLQIAAGEAVGSGYRALGGVELGGEAILGNISVVFPDSYDSDVSAPSVVFMSQTQAVCDPEADCLVDFAGQRMELLPQKISLATSKLNLGLLQPVTDTTVSEVIYSVDDVPAYTGQSLERFNLNYVPNGNHNLQRSVLLQSGQVLRDIQAVSRGSSGQLHYTFIAAYYRYRTIVNFILLLIVLPVSVAAALVVVDSVRRRRHWRRTHTAGVVQDFQAEKARILAELNAPPREESYLDTAWRYKWWWAGFSGFLLAMLLISAQVMTIFTVDGPSMEPTLRSGSKKLVLKLPVSLARLNRSVYTPERGQIVVFQHEAGHFLGAATVQSANYVVKRVIGLPGERVVIKDGVITVFRNGIAAEPDAEGSWGASVQPSTGYLVDLTLGPGELFVVGDNRFDSLDSRTFGAVSTTAVVGVVR